MQNRKWLLGLFILSALALASSARAANLGGILVELLGAPATSPSALDSGPAPTGSRQRVADEPRAVPAPAPVALPESGERGTDAAPAAVDAEIGKPLAEPRRPARRGAKLRTLLPGSIR
jgi:hypothetical protein